MTCSLGTCEPEDPESCFPSNLSTTTSPTEFFCLAKLCFFRATVAARKRDRQRLRSSLRAPAHQPRSRKRWALSFFCEGGFRIKSMCFFYTLPVCLRVCLVACLLVFVLIDCFCFVRLSVCLFVFQLCVLCLGQTRTSATRDKKGESLRSEHQAGTRSS